MNSKTTKSFADLIRLYSDRVLNERSEIKRMEYFSKIQDALYRMEKLSKDLEKTA